MRRHAHLVLGIAFAGLTLGGPAAAFGSDEMTQEGVASRACGITEDIGTGARTVMKLSAGDAVVVYLPISTESHFFVKRKNSAPGEGSGWVSRKLISMATGETEPSADEPDAPLEEAELSRPQRIEAAVGSAPVPQKEAARSPSAPVDTDDWDIPASHWAMDSVKTLVSNGLLKVPGGKFDGDTKVSRYELAVIAERLMRESQTSYGNLADQVGRVMRENAEIKDEVHDISGRIDKVEHKIAKLPESRSTEDAQARQAVEKLGKEVTGLRQTFVRSIAGIALDRSRIDQYHSSLSKLVGVLESLEKRVTLLEVPPQS